MLKEINRNNVLNALRQHEERFSKYPNSQNVIVLQRQDWNDDVHESVSFDVEVRFAHPNYIYLLSVLFNAEKNIVKDGGFGIDIFSLVARIKIIVKQLEDDGYLRTDKQKYLFTTEYGKKMIYDEDGSHEIYINAREKFSKDEHDALGVAIVLTTKGQDKLLYLKERLFSEPIGSFSLLVSIIAVFASIF